MSDSTNQQATSEVPQGGRGAGRMMKRVYKRFTRSQRLQHFLLASSFLGLIATGFPMRFPLNHASQILIRVLGGINSVGVIHRVLGCIMLLAAILHVVYLVGQYLKGHRGFPILFGKGDGATFLHDLKFILQLTDERPNFGRFNWREKFDYFGALFGVALMGVTGLVIWFPQYFTELFPGWVITASVILHDYEAILAGLAIFLSHFYWVHLNPEVYPMSTVWLTGDISEEELREQHPLEYEQILAGERKSPFREVELELKPETEQHTESEVTTVKQVAGPEEEVAGPKEEAQEEPDEA